ncbi:MAG TPA: DNA recombination protein RmuC [Xylella sp.]
MQPDFLILVCFLCIVLVLQIVVFLRRSDHAVLDHALREEQRVGRAELREQLEALDRQQEVRLGSFARSLMDLSVRIDQRLDQLCAVLAEDARKGRQEAGEGQQRFTDAFGQRLTELTQRNGQAMDEMRATLEQQLRVLRADNAQQLEQIRIIVDEKLQTTLNNRLDSSFRLVSERLEQVQRGLGEMQQLATGVGDLKRVLTSVKSRGTWGEVQLDNILDQTLTQEQYARGVRVCPDASEIVDFAVCLPGRGQYEAPVWLPIDAKYPREDYERLLDAQEQGDQELVRTMGIQLERVMKIQAKSIRDKYIVPPHTTDFAVMFLPTEGLYAETIRRPGLTDVLQREYRVVVAGPTTVTALLNSLQMGFRTLAIEQRSSEVWRLLGAVKSEFGKFAGILEKAEKQISTVGKSLGEAGRKTRTIERRLKGVESLSHEQTQGLFDGLEVDEGEGEADSDAAF